MADKFSPVIRQARFNAPGYSPQAMINIGTEVLRSIFARLDRAQDVYDLASPGLAPKYAAYKSRRYGSGIRDLKATGRTRRGTRVVEAGQNFCYLGFSDPIAALRTRLNNRVSRQWGLSPVNIQALVRAIHLTDEKPVTATQKF